MLRVFKWRSPMSVGVWTLSAFGGAATLALALEGIRAPGALETAFGAALLAAAVLGSLVATYTGVLLGVTAVPVWNTHVRTLPLHFGAAALGSAGAALELLGHRMDALHILGLLAAGTETALFAWNELHREGTRDEALRRGRSGALVRAAGTLMGPLALALRLSGWRTLAAGAFLVGSLLSRFGWIEAGRASVKNPAAVL
jgi:formate-dependent nitrite reductase membrane component NrfD